MKTGRICIDKMHQKNHIGCSRGYDASYYPDLENVNTQTCEQLNSQVKRLAKMVRYCKPSTAWQIFTTYMCLRNFLRREGQVLDD